ncbi:hypothetical protein PRZ48_002800 [Zasmidium cellare]|uniref:Uncharacterized protein n=1 Tax=Zasmidium cellare TaxID=395010 RepID=A0ABR0ETG0_ZASCE|nr:hypothetical protein PRZ48_002800 [Zasmidium cellare]
MDLGWVQTTFPPSKRPACLRTGGHHERTVKFTIPNDREKAKEVIERTCREKRTELEKHANHRDCRVLADLEKCRRRLPLLFGTEWEEKQYRRRLMLLSWKEEEEEKKKKNKESGKAGNRTAATTRTTWSSGAPKDPNLLAITKVCRQMRKETSQLFYSLNTFTHPMRFHRFGKTMSKEQMRRYGVRLKHGRKWLRAIGSANSGAISRYVIDLGEWEMENAVGLVSREWRTMARRLERKLLLPMLRQSAISMSMTLVIDHFHIYSRYPFTLPMPCLLGEGTRLRECFAVTFTMPDDQKMAGEAIERTYRAKLKEMEGHIDHQDCLVVEWLPTIRAGLKKCREAMMHAIGLKDQEVEDVADAVGELQIV